METSELRGADRGGLVRSVIMSYGDGHHAAPRGSALLVDTRVLRNPPEDPAVRERMIHSNGMVGEVRDYVLATPGASRLVERSVEQLLALLDVPPRSGEQPLRVDVHVVCGGGRHRSVAVAEAIGARARAAGVGCEVEHLHVERPILT
ncbi:hypothetical protein OG610_39025 (plasmid) [Streptomyces anulatus]